MSYERFHEFYSRTKCGWACCRVCPWRSSCKSCNITLVTDLINPVLGLVLGSTKGLKAAYLPIFGAKVMFGNFLSVLIDFLVIAAVVYFVVHGLKLDKVDKKK
ncbi:hypothetical protein CO051_05205 [Candidatus Roizmanbacteria bacterium CG_4_9_14_0_2_um_filter_39_13]|uniref:Large conductance mechanosensitive channel protein MscL n=1 Tax=Candidatus Roizmanbacteria bacterium CG_4_9_14_0_2_um_filter_39_13 TaxID=1974839 RepID=A0A2M8EXD8_9BACT|nr:MAG: hypothetical protein CO051_05205 [Candidatus Roizmanbacteria bacterium CG_4_9_14_0_2_um_filter_39_13]